MDKLLDSYNLLSLNQDYVESWTLSSTIKEIKMLIKGFHKTNALALMDSLVNYFKYLKRPNSKK